MEAYHITVFENINSIMEKGLIPTIGDRSKKLNESVKRIYLFPSLDDVYTALGNWLGDEFDEDDEIVLLKVLLDKQKYNQEVSWELCCYDTISPENISIFLKQI